MPSNRPSRTVSGRVLRADGQPLGGTGFTVRAFDVISPDEMVSLSNALPLINDSAYRISYSWTVTSVRKTPNLLIQLLDPRGLVIGQALKPRAKATEILDITLEASASTFDFMVTGTIRQSDGPPLAGAIVHISDWDRGGEDPLVVTITDEKGNYQGRFTAAQFRSTQGEVRGPDLIVQVYNGQGQLLAKSPRKNNSRSVETIDLIVTVLKSGSPDNRVVRGCISHADGFPLSGIVVRAFDRDLGSEQLLGQATGDSEGGYEIFYTSAQFRRAEKKRADLMLRFYTPNGREIQSVAFSTESEVSLKILNYADAEGHPKPISVWFNAPSVAILNAEVSGNRYQDVSEYESHLRELEPLFEGASGTSFSGTDMEFCAAETGIEYAHIGFLSIASRLSGPTGIKPPVFYGLFRQSLPTDLSLLLAREPGELREALRKSVDDNIIPLMPDSELDGILSGLQGLLHRFFAGTLQTGKKVPLSDFLTTVLPNADLRNRFLSEYAAYDGKDQEKFWTGLQSQTPFQGGVAEQIRFTFEAGPMAFNYLPLVEVLQRERRDGRIESVRDLAGLDESDWMGLFDKGAGNRPIGIPNGVPGKTSEERRKNFAQVLVRMAETTFPTHAFTVRLERDPELPERQDLLAFLKGNPDFELDKTPFRRYVRERGEAVLAGVVNPESIASAQRVFKLVRRYEMVKPLLAGKLHSALAISRMGEARFISAYAEPMGGTAQASMTFQQASYHSDLALAVLTKHHTAFDRVQPWMIPSSRPGESGPTLSPDLEMLFGSLTACDCEHCRSIFSPAAYLVDALMFLKGTTSNLLEAFNHRRPDIGALELTCANTHTPLPFIDLVNEILENAVVSRESHGTLMQPLSPLFGAEGAPAWPQTRASAEELRAVPEYTLDRAYQALSESGSVYPSLLPFDLWLETARVYLRHLGSSRQEVMRLFQQDGFPSDAAIAWESLGISEIERAILVGAPEIGTRRMSLPEYYGYAPATGNAELIRLLSQSIPELLYRVDIQYKGLLEVLDTRFVNPGRQVVLAAPVDADCDINRYHLAKRGPGSPPPPLAAEDIGFFDRLHRFMRLRRILGWSVPELDRTIQALGDPVSEGSDQKRINDGLLERLAGIQALAPELRIPVEEAISLWASINTHGETPLYQRLFLNKIVSNPVSQDFELRSDLSELACVPAVPSEPRPTLNVEHISIILAALRIKASDYSALTNSGINDTTLTLENLSRLHRYALLARALRLPIPDLLTLLRMVSAHPFASVKDTREFVVTVGRIRRSKFKLMELAYLFLHASDAAAQLEPDEVWISAIARTLQAGLPVSRNLESPESESVSPATEAQLWMESSAELRAELTAESTLEAADSILPLTDSQIDAALDFLAVPQVENPANPASLSELRASLAELFGQFLDPAVAETTLLGATTTASAKSGYVLGELRAYRSRRNLIVQTLANALKLDSDTTNLLITRLIPASTIRGQGAIRDFTDFAKATPVPEGESVPDRIRAHILRLHKSALLIKGFEFDAEEVRHFATNLAEGVLPLDFNRIPIRIQTDETIIQTLFQQWLYLYEYQRLRELVAGRKSRLIDVIRLPSTTNPEIWKPALSAATGWDSEAIAELVFEDVRSPRKLLVLHQRIALSGRLGIAFNQLRSWASIAPSAAQAKQIRQAVKAKYDDKEWLAVVRPLEGVLREKRRDALVAFLVHRPELWLSAGKISELSRLGRRPEASLLYEYFLVDVEMSACQSTSRVRQAIGAVQLFIQRCLMGLEGELSISPGHAREWETWMKTYRSWEANRKVFVYPENWAVPELRDDQTPNFKVLVNALLQSDVTDQSVEAAFLNYLDQLNDLAKLDIMGMYAQKESGVDILHVFGRTSGIPHRYFTRKRIDSRYWTAWEKIEVDIEGDHLIPMVWNRRLYLFWPVFSEKVYPKSVVRESDEGVAPRKYLEIKLAYSEYRNGQWSSRKVSGVSIDGVKALVGALTEERRKILFSASETEDGMRIRCFEPTSEVQYLAAREFFMSSGTGDIQVRWMYPALILIYMTRYTTANGSKYHHTGDYLPPTDSIRNRLYLPGVDSSRANNIIALEMTNGNYDLLTPHQLGQFSPSKLPFFFQDKDRVFFVNKEAPVSNVDQAIVSDSILPTLRAGVRNNQWGSVLDLGDGVAPDKLNGEFDWNMPDAPPPEALGEDSGNAPILSAIFTVSPQGYQPTLESRKRYVFRPFNHPYVGFFIKQVNRYGIEGMLNPDPEGELRLYGANSSSGMIILMRFISPIAKSSPRITWIRLTRSNLIRPEPIANTIGSCSSMHRCWWLIDWRKTGSSPKPRNGSTTYSILRLATIPPSIARIPRGSGSCGRFLKPRGIAGPWMR